VTKETTMKTTTKTTTKTANLSKDQWDVLEGMDIEPEDLAQIDGTTINLHGEAWTDGKVLVFVNCPPGFEAKFIYYLGAERESEITARWRGLTIYTKIDTSRLTRYRR
jgi:hypothetical protein